MGSPDIEAFPQLLDRLEEAWAADQVEMTSESSARYRAAREAVEFEFNGLRYNITRERMTCEISAALRRLAVGRPEIAPLLVEAAGKLDGLIDCLATAERERDDRVYRADVVGVRNPDAEFIEHAPGEDVPALIAEVEQLRAWLAELERMRPVVEAAKEWRRFFATVAVNGTMFVHENELIAAVDALESSGFDPSLGQVTEEQEVPKDCPRCGGLDGTHTVRNCGEHRPVAGDDFMQSGWCGGCEACGPAPQVCVVCSYPDRAPNHPVNWPCEFAPAEASTEAVQ